MAFLTQTYQAYTLYFWEELINDWFFLVALGFLAFELLRYGLKRRLTWNLLGDAVTNYITLAMFIGITFLIGAIYLSAFFFIYETYRFWTLPITVWSIVLAIVLADFIYYWEHRFMHRVGIGWATHTVHHSSPYFNISVAYRFGPLDGIVPFFFHAPLLLLGLHPFLVFFAEVVVQIYQTLLHTETIGKLPRPIETVMNTPSHHRVHHGSNPAYLDKNYAGILIIWDRMFGTFEEEKETVTYGLVEPIDSINSLTVFFHGFVRLGSSMARAGSVGNALACLIKPPGWKPGMPEPPE